MCLHLRVTDHHGLLSSLIEKSDLTRRKVYNSFHQGDHLITVIIPVLLVGEYSRIPQWDLKIIYKHYCKTLPHISAITRLNFSLRDSRIKPHNYLQEQLDLDERVSLAQYFFHSVYRGYPKMDSSRKAYRCSYKNGTRTGMYYHVQECKFVHWRLNLF